MKSTNAILNVKQAQHFQIGNMNNCQDGYTKYRKISRRYFAEANKSIEKT